MRKMIVLALCLALLAGAVSAVSAESGLTGNETVAQWEEQYGDSRLWDYRVNADFALQHPKLLQDSSPVPVLPDQGNGAISAEKAKKLAYKLIPEYGTEITFDALVNLTCIVSSYRKADDPGSFFSRDGSWEIRFWDTQGEEPQIVCSIYIDAQNETPDVFLLASGVRYEIRYESGPEEAVRIDPDGENSEAGRARMEAREIAAGRFTADYGINEYYRELTEQLGPFRFWTPEQKHQHMPVLDELLFWEKERLEMYHAGEAWPTGLLEDSVLQWAYGDPASAAVPEEEARQKALDFLRTKYDMDCADCRTAVTLYTGHWHNNPFADPWWVFTFFEGDERKAEVWVNARTGDMPEYRMDDAEAVTLEQFSIALREGYEIGGQPVTEEMIDDVAVFYLEEENEWYGIVEVGDSYWEIEIDADTLETIDTVRSNG